MDPCEIVGMTPRGVEKIFFFTQDVDFLWSEDQARPVRVWIHAVAKAERYVVVHLNVIFCSDIFLLGVNKLYLKHDTLTDVIAFDHKSSASRVLEGDLYISVERVQENAQVFGRFFREELHHVMLHGLLHFMGYDDKRPGDRRMMRAKEQTYGQLLASMMPNYDVDQTN